MAKFNGFVDRNTMSAGSNTDMTIAYILRGVMILLLAALVFCFVGMRDDLRDIKKEWPDMKKDIGELKQHAATKEELRQAEDRVKTEFAAELQRAKVVTSTQGK